MSPTSLTRSDRAEVRPIPPSRVDRDGRGNGLGRRPRSGARPERLRLLRRGDRPPRRHGGHQAQGSRGPSNGGTYETLADVHAPLTDGAWHDVRIVTYDDRGTVRIELWLDGTNVLNAADAGQVDPPILEPGRVGIRADNFEVSFDDVTVA